MSCIVFPDRAVFLILEPFSVCMATWQILLIVHSKFTLYDLDDRFGLSPSHTGLKAEYVLLCMYECAQYAYWQAAGVFCHFVLVSLASVLWVWSTAVIAPWTLQTLDPKGHLYYPYVPLSCFPSLMTSLSTWVSIAAHFSNRTFFQWFFPLPGISTAVLSKHVSEELRTAEIHL